MKRLMQQICFCPCNTLRSIFRKPSHDGISALPPPHAMEEYEVLKEQPKGQLRSANSDAGEEKWMGEFEPWDKKPAKEAKKEEKKTNLVELDVEAIVKEQVLVVCIVVELCGR
eukprot:TRINITY_DN8746_c0_g1_i1.p1 TRINITY_DN8746_c0_g1~~TRINITY_DN8746_c0_g1_i1.p1  ORF type:complete len:126 (-),score=29.68 TRINITY_DN8746_c0_g1_i1:276-614(-)